MFCQRNSVHIGQSKKRTGSGVRFSRITLGRGRLSPPSCDTCCSCLPFQTTYRRDSGRSHTTYGLSPPVCACQPSNSVAPSTGATVCRDRPCSHFLRARRAWHDRKLHSHFSPQTSASQEHSCPEPALRARKRWHTRLLTQ